jgi:hypothetical protein
VHLKRKSKHLSIVQAEHKKSTNTPAVMAFSCRTAGAADIEEEQPASFSSTQTHTHLAPRPGSKTTTKIKASHFELDREFAHHSQHSYLASKEGI